MEGLKPAEQCNGKMKPSRRGNGGLKPTRDIHCERFAPREGARQAGAEDVRVPDKPKLKMDVWRWLNVLGAGKRVHKPGRKENRKADSLAADEARKAVVSDLTQAGP